MSNSAGNHSLNLDPKYNLLAGLQEECFSRNITNNTIFIYDFNSSNIWCPRLFDGFSCWGETPAASTASQSCPGYVIGFDPRRTVYKYCTANGTWLNGSNNRPWTNYTTCVDVEDLYFRIIVNYLYVVGYIASVIGLVLSMIIFLYFRSLRCARIRIHMHLFSAFIINNTFWIIWYLSVVNNAEVVRQNNVWCIVLHIITYYFTTSSYFWMFIEGMFLHVSLVVVFVNPRLVRRSIIFAWGAPVFIVSTYACVRYHIPEDAERCWIDSSVSFWVILTPVGMTVIASSYFLVSVVHELYIKFTPFAHENNVEAARKAGRAALILIPLFGVQFLLMPVRLSPETPGEKFYAVFCAIFTSFQGLSVAVLFCFTNHDVMQAIRRFLSRFFGGNDNIAAANNAIPLATINLV